MKMRSDTWLRLMLFSVTIRVQVQPPGGECHDIFGSDDFVALETVPHHRQAKKTSFPIMTTHSHQ